jgi:large subunit ribosomal protein L35
LNNKERIMPKMKTNRGAAKRFKATGTGKIRRSKAFTSHILTSKSTKRKRNLRQSGLIDAADTKAVRRMLPYL